LADLQIDDEDMFCVKLEAGEKDGIPQVAKEYLQCLRKAASKDAQYAHSTLEALTPADATRALELVIDYAMRREQFFRSDWHKPDSRFYSTWYGNFVFCYYSFEIEESCYDGGSGGTDTVTRSKSLVLKYVGAQSAEWTQAKTDWKTRVKDGIAFHNQHPDWYGSPIRDVDAFTTECRKRFGYHGSLEQADTPILPNPFSGEMTLLNPFGLPGVFKIKV